MYIYLCIYLGKEFAGVAPGMLGGVPLAQEGLGHEDPVAALKGKLMSCSHVKRWVNLLTWLLIDCSLLRCAIRSQLAC